MDLLAPYRRGLDILVILIVFLALEVTFIFALSFPDRTAAIKAELSVSPLLILLDSDLLFASRLCFRLFEVWLERTVPLRLLVFDVNFVYIPTVPQLLCAAVEIAFNTSE